MTFRIAALSRSVLLLVTATAACSSPTGRAEFTPEPAPSSSDGDGSSGSSGSLGAPSTGTSPTASNECTKMDIVFVVDNSPSMEEEQANLAQNFPDFVGVLDQYKTKGGSSLDYRVAITTTDTKTDKGAFRRTGTGCNAGSARPWLERSDGDITGPFTCRANVGTQGDNYERALHGLQLALTDRVADGTNEFMGTSFLRSEALLAVVIVTDEDEGGIENKMLGTIPGYVSAFDAIKGARDRWAAALIAGVEPHECTSTLGDAIEARRLKDFVTQVGKNGVSSSICAGNLSQGLKAALQTFTAACEDLQPPRWATSSKREPRERRRHVAALAPQRVWRRRARDVVGEPGQEHGVHRLDRGRGLSVRLRSHAHRCSCCSPS